MSDQETPKVRFTQHMTMHLNGGSKFSELHYRVEADGRKTLIRRHKRTDGRPKYLITDDIFTCGDDTFDILETKGVGLEEWLLAHMGTEEEGEPSP